MGIKPRSDQVGSLRRPDFLMEARREFREGAISREALREQEDAAILGALARQRDAGIEILTDGEYRRDAWQTDISDALDGFVSRYPTREQKLPDGSTVALEVHSKAIERKLKQTRRITGHEVAFMNENSAAPFKITMPSPNIIVWASYQAGITEKAYKTRSELRQDLIPIYQAEVQALISEGVRYIQFDEGFMRYAIPGWRDSLEALGVGAEEAFAEDIATENAIYDSVSHEGVVFASHLCQGSRTAARGEGDYAYLAERLFADLHVERFLLEDDADQLGSYELLRFLPPEKTVVLGLVTSKYPEIESPEEIRRKVDEAAKHCSLDQLAISPQCGFGGSADNNFMTYDQQFLKLDNIARAAQSIWK
jgi:5-methyltetrahydropteroyltriglutamate--homocysteine methyltransferase